MKRFQFAAVLAFLGVGLSLPALAADTTQPKSDYPSTQSGQPGATTGEGQTGQKDPSKADTTKPKSDQPSSQSGPVDTTTGQGQTGQTDPSKADTTKPKSDTPATGASAQSPITVQLQPKDNSGVSGTATLTPQGDQTRVVVQLKGAASNVAQPAHFHSGTCDKLDPKPKYPLADVVNGTSTTVISAPVSELASGQYTINIHKSAADVKISVAYGNVKS